MKIIAVKYFILILFCAQASVFAGKVPAIIPAKSLPDSIPWNLKSLSRPPEFKLLDCNDRIWSLTYHGESFQEKPFTEVFAYYSTPGILSGNPKKDRNLPAIVLVHGKGGTAYKQWVEMWASRGYAAIAMDLNGSTPGRKKLLNGGPAIDPNAFSKINLPITHQWPYHGVANVIKAHSLLMSFKEVDSSRTAITGISWGGYVTCIAAGIDNRFKAAVPVYGCGFLYEDSRWKNQFAQLTADDRNKCITLWDPSSYTASTSVPIFFISGTDDFAYPLASMIKTFELIKGQRNIRITPHMKHSHPAGWNPKEIFYFIDQYLNDGKPIPQITSPVMQDNKAIAILISKTKPKSVKLNYTFDSNPSEDRKWQTIDANISKNTITAPLPPNTAVWFFTVKDEHDCIISSRPFRDPDSNISWHLSL